MDMIVRDTNNTATFTTALDGLKWMHDIETWEFEKLKAWNFNHHPITKPEKMQNCSLYLNHLFFQGPFFKPISTFYQMNWDSEVHFDNL